MSHFAERLMARNRGAPQSAGLSLLTPRRPAFFEPAATAAPAALAEAETMTNPALSGETQPAALRTPPSTVWSLDEPARTSPLNMEAGPRESSSIAARQPAGVQPPSGNAIPHWPSQHALPPVHEIDAAAGQSHQPAAHSEMPAQALSHLTPSETSARMTDPDPSIRYMINLPEPAPQPMAAVPGLGRRAPPAGDRALQAEAPPVPAISIGRIDVQFLPRDMPKPLVRAAAQRSHGFAAYDRARRGEPR